MTTPIDIVCSDFTKIIRREVGETMRLLVTKSSQNAFCTRLAKGAKSLQGAYTT